MKEIISTIMCLSFVSGTYEVVVDTYMRQNVWYTGGGYCGKTWAKDESENHVVSEDYVRTLLTDDEWQELCANGIIECEKCISKI